jgi:hypothetical protein
MLPKTRAMAAKALLIALINHIDIFPFSSIRCLIVA